MIEKLQRLSTIYYLLTQGKRVTSDEMIVYLATYRDIVAYRSMITRDLRFFKEEFGCDVKSSRIGSIINSELSFLEQIEISL